MTDGPPVSLSELAAIITTETASTDTAYRFRRMPSLVISLSP